jgi:beta-aspartyl-dipeptidase (metallo-type)
MFLFNNATVYAPAKLGKRDVLVVNGRIAAVSENLTVSLPGLETIDAGSLILTPGLIDQHIHLTGGGGEGGLVSRVPEVPFSSLVASGTTTVVGVLGTDSVTRPVHALLAKVRALKEEGLSGWMYTSNYALPPSLLSGTIRNDLFLVPEVVGVKVAHADHRSSFPTVEELLRILSDVRVGGMIAGKIGVLHVHMGNLPDGFALFSEIVRRGMPVKHIRPSHCARDKALFEQALVFNRQGGLIDITSGGTCFSTPAAVIRQLKEEKADLGKVTMSTDGGGSIPRFDDKGNMIGLGTGSPSANIRVVRELVCKDGLELELVLPMVTSNVAENLGLTGKGILAAGQDADICCFTRDMQLRHVMAKGRILLRDEALVVKGMFEE